MASTIMKFAHLQIPLEDIVKATHNFHEDNIIGRGGFGPAYKGQLQRSGKLIKITALRLDRKLGEGDVEFWTEISVLSDLKHTNLVSIIGFCDEKNEKIIITTYAAKGSLKEHLNNPSLTWTQRLKIGVGVARALSYLHYDEGRGYGVIHLNVNSSSILLDENWEPKLSGFKVSMKQSFNRMEEIILSEPVGTIGYMDPEILKAKGVTYKSDIYSFGVVLFEILCGRRSYVKNEANKFLAPLAKYHYENETLHDILHHNLKNQMSAYQISLGSIKKYSKVAYFCLKEEQILRPHTVVIVEQLEKALERALKFQPQAQNFVMNLEHLKIPLDDIKLATHNFSDAYKTNVSDFHIWYTAELDHLDKKPSSVEGKSKIELPKRPNTVEIKRFLPINDEHEEELFFTELEMLTSVKHHNIVTLIGFCVEGFEMILVTEKFSNGPLRDYLGNAKKMRILTWEKRLKICIDVAHALNYLHYEMEGNKMIVHNSINNGKICLNEHWRVKIVDFEWAVFLHPNQKDEVMCKRTYFESKYHVDPEYVNTVKLKRESDVYSFGVVLFEMLCGRYAGDEIYCKESEKGLVHVARQNFFLGTLDDMIDPILKEESEKKSFIPNRGANKDSLHTFSKVANQCVAETQDQRPTMRVVLKELEKALLFQEERLQHPNKDQVVDDLLIPIHEILEGERPYMDELVDKHKKAMELHHIHEIINLEHLKIPLTHIQSATDNFSKTYKIAILGGVQFYRAELEYYDKENHLSKRHNTVLIIRYPYGQEEFFTEMEMLMSVKHPNIATVLGFCLEPSETILVIDNFFNGFLDDYLTNIDKLRILTWEKRLKICIDVAHALKYIHSEMEGQKMIINRDICSNNIGLDKNWRAKIVSFKNSVFLPPNKENQGLYDNIRIGRLFHRDPEYFMTGNLKRESDIFSFGVVLFEILCGRTAYNPIYKESDKGLGLGSVGRQCFRMGTLEEMIDPIIKQEISENIFSPNRGPNKDSLQTFMEIAYQCVAETQDQRPTMEVVVKKLEKALFFQKNNKDNPRISLEDIAQATQNFHNDNCIGGGGFGRVYKGNLRDGDGFKTVVAKRLDTRFGQGEQQFLSELQILLEYRHENVIDLVGYCDEKNEKILVYEYEPKGSLDRYLNDVSLTWVERLNICIDVASALYFFHGGLGKQAKVIHRDIKSDNVLLNHYWKAKLADFGLSLISPLTHEIDYVIDHACGTLGYLDPLYKKLGFLTIESDIYSFGVVLFEILCGRSTFIMYKDEGQYLADFIKKKFEEGKKDEVVFDQIREHIKPKSLATFQKIAYQCLHHEREERPTTKEVLVQLKKALTFQMMPSTMTKFAPLQIPLEDVVKATNNFHHNHIIMHCGFGTAYKGRLLKSGKLMEVAARKFDCKNGEGDLLFLTEISVLSDIKHTNIVSIIGFCDDKDEKIILTTYESNGSLSQYLSSPDLTWNQRLRICIGVARALSYLHHEEGRDYAILHCNINSDMILLDEHWEAKLSGFEMSIKQSVNHKDQVCLCEHSGIMGCMDPAIEKTGGVTHKSDIYSFGVVLFETLYGRKPYIEKENNRFLAPLAELLYENKALEDVIHPKLRNQMSTRSFLKYSNVAYSCLNEDQAYRPNIDNIVDALEKALETQLQHGNIQEKKWEHLKIRFDDIKSATNNFSETYIVAYENYYTLYRAELVHFDKESPSSEKGKNPKRHNIVLIKRYPYGNELYGEEEFFKEIETLMSVKHPNIVTLLGICAQPSEMILVIDNFSNGFLGHYLGDFNYEKRRILSWEKRLTICIDVAHALKYIHSEMEDQQMLINCDICSYNIGLDENWGAKIVHFCKSVFLPPNQEDQALYINSFTARHPYLDPQFEKTGKLKRESDVFSFGVVLFEILCGRTAYDPIYLKENDKGLAYVARRCFNTGTLKEMIDSIIMEETAESSFNLNRGPKKESLDTFIEIAYQCVAETQDQRPTMKVVVKKLEKALFFQVKKLEHLKIPLTNIKSATDNFSKTYTIESGDGFAWYRAELEHFDKENPSSEKGKNNGEHPKQHNTVLIKRYPSSGYEFYREEDFLSEIEVLTSVKHPNVVTLLGFCLEHSEMIHVIDEFSNGFLGSNLGKVEKMRILNWEKRLKICIDVAHALKYIHSEMEDHKMIINRDIWSFNIGLDDNLRAKIVSFNISVYLPPNQEDEALYFNGPIGRPSYIDPQYKKTSKLKRESDVFAFGVVLFEILCGRLAYDPIYLKENDKGLAYVACRCFSTGTLKEMIDPIIMDETDESSLDPNIGPNKDSLGTFSEIAYRCVIETQDQRPTMEIVVKELEKALFFQEKNLEHLKIPLTCIKSATDNFSETSTIEFGDGYIWYRAELEHFDKENPSSEKRKNNGEHPKRRNSILIKRYPSSGYGLYGEEGFLTEIEVLTSVKHPNIVNLLGFCLEPSEMILVIDKFSNGLLGSYLGEVGKMRILNWEKRLKICIDVAHALKYVHSEMEDQKMIINRDICSYIIGLDENFRAKIFSFNASVFLPPNQEDEALYLNNYIGRSSYIDPQYEKTGKLKRESDVFGFGVVLFEILCGRLAYDPIYLKENDKGLAYVARRCFNTGTLKEMIDPIIMDETDESSLDLNRGPKKDSLDTFIEIAYQCVAETQDLRPTMKAIVQELEKALFLQVDGSASKKQQGIYSWEEKTEDQSNTLG